MADYIGQQSLVSAQDMSARRDEVLGLIRS